MFSGTVLKENKMIVSISDSKRGIRIGSIGRDNEALSYSVKVDENSSKDTLFYFAHRWDNVYHARLKDYEWTISKNIICPETGEIDEVVFEKGEELTKGEKQFAKEHIIEAFAAIGCEISVDFRTTPWTLFSH